MKQSITTWLLGIIILMSGCQKDEEVLQPLKPKSLANVSANTFTDGVDQVTGSMSDSYLGNHDLDFGGPGMYFSLIESEPVGHVNYYYGKIEIMGSYRTRTLHPLVTIFYQYDYDRYKGRIYKIGAPEQGEGEGKLSFIGSPGEIEAEYVNGVINPATATTPYQTLTADGNAVYGANEKRTIVRSVNGRIKVEYGFKAAAFEVGSEIEGGFTVQSATNETGVHSGDVAYSVKVQVSGWTQLYPVFQRTGTLNGVFYGTLKD